MAGFFSNGKIISAFFVDRLSVTATRRGYASAAGVLQNAVSSSGRGGGNVMMKKGEGESGKTNSWIPDPVTGCYRPENRTGEIDAAELRRMVLKNKN